MGIDYHAVVRKHFYSVPFSLIREVVEIRLTAGTVEAFHEGQRVASHVRAEGPGFTTDSAHMPDSHRQHAEWSPGRMVRWAATIGPLTERLVAGIMESRRHPEQGYRSCLGIMRLARRFGEPRLEAACGRALALGIRSYRPVESILKNGLDQVSLDPVSTARPPQHGNVRGPNYYQ